MTTDKTNTPAFTQCMENPGNDFVDADGTTAKVIATAGAKDARIYHVTVTSTDTAANKIYLFINNGTKSRGIGWCDLAALAGTDGATDSVSVLAATSFTHRRLDNAGNPFFQLKATYTLEMSLGTAVGATFEVNAIVEQEDY